eukprot:6951491-Alexandrium_andersonii.AAC.1
MAPGLLLPGGRRCTPPSWRASDSPEGRRARVASTTPSSTSGASCAETTSPSPATTWTSTSSRSS